MVNVTAFDISFKNIGCEAFGVFIERLKAGSPTSVQKKKMSIKHHRFVLKFDKNKFMYYGQYINSNERNEEPIDDSSFMSSLNELNQASLDKSLVNETGMKNDFLINEANLSMQTNFKLRVLL
jgi:hypothetical protein